MAPRKRKSRKKKSSGGAALRAAVFLLLLVTGGAAAWLVFTPFGPESETFVELAPGSSTARIGQQLESAGVVRSRYAFDLLRWVKRGTLRAGEYRFDQPAPLTEVYARIVRGDVFTRAVTVPEGASIFEIAARLQQAGFGGRSGPRSQEPGGLPVPGYISFCPQGDSGADCSRHGTTLPDRSRATGIEGERAHSGDYGFADRTGDGGGCGAAAGG
jgi:hypothetical protein